MKKIKIEGLEPDKLNPKNFGGMCSRSNAILTRAEGKEVSDGIDTIATTDAPAVVVDWERWELVREILPMKYCELPKNNKAPLLDAHSRGSIEDVVGSARDWRTDESELLCKIFISDSEEDIKTKIKEGHVDSVSVGYQTDPAQTVEIPKKTEVIIDGVAYKNEFADDMPLLVRTWWKIKELSLVAIGADEAAKLKREYQSKFSESQLKEKLDEAVNQIKELKSQIKGGYNMPELTNTEKTAAEMKLELINSIDEAAGNFGEAGQKLANEFRQQIREGKDISIKDFYKSATDLIMKSGGVHNKPVTHLGMSKSELDEFSPSRAVQNILLGKRSGLEFEINQELEKKTGLSSSERSILIPSDYQNVGLRELVNTRAHSTTATQGGDLITDSFQGNLLKEVIRNQTVLGQAGITIITGLRADKFQLPKITTGLTIYPVAENIAATTSYVVTGLEEVGSKRLSGNTEYGRELFFKTDGSLAGFDQILMKDLYQALDVQVDYEGINGTGLSNRPTGILNQSNILAPSLSTLDLTHIVNVIRKVAKQNGLKDTMKWLNSVDVQCSLRKTPVFPTGHTDRTLYENGMIEGYQSISSNQVPDAVNILGLWPEFYMLNWGVEELIVADQPKHKEWMVEISLHRLVNFFLRSPESFAISNDVPVAEWDDLDA